MENFDIVLNKDFYREFQNNDTTVKLINGDCLIHSESIESASVDLICTDLPYGTIHNIDLKGWDFNNSNWDIALDPKEVFKVASRILRFNGKLVLFSQEPYTTKLIINAPKDLSFNYRMIWKKDHFANCLSVNKAPVSYYEDILVFTKIYDTELKHPLREYFQKVLKFIKLTKSQIIKTVGSKACHT